MYYAADEAAMRHPASEHQFAPLARAEAEAAGAGPSGVGGARTACPDGVGVGAASGRRPRAPSDQRAAKRKLLYSTSIDAPNRDVTRYWWMSTQAAESRAYCWTVSMLPHVYSTVPSVTSPRS